MKKIVPKAIGLFINTTAKIAPTWSTNYSFDLLCKVRRVGISEKGKDFFDSGEQLTLDNGVYSTVLHRWGTGEKSIFFLHGWMSNSQRWLPYVESLDLNEYTVYALDAPGHGLSKGNKLTLEAFRQGVAIALKKVGPIDTMVCHSFGSLAGAYSFLVDPKIIVKKYVIMGAPSGLDAIFVFFETLLGLSDRAIQQLNVKVDSILKIPTEEITIAHFFQKVEEPVLVVHEVSDAITPFEPIRKASEENSNVKTFFTEGQDHNLKGAETINRIIEFIRE